MYQMLTSYIKKLLKKIRSLWYTFKGKSNYPLSVTARAKNENADLISLFKETILRYTPRHRKAVLATAMQDGCS